jgi:uncharacterized protein
VFIALEQLQDEPVRFDESFAPDQIDYATEGLRQVAALQVAGIASLLGAEIHIRGSLGTQLELECARCLEPVAQNVNRDFDLYYRSLEESPEQNEVAVPRGEEELAFYSGEGLLLEDVAKEQVLLSLPMRTVCRADCKGLCPHCGINRNRESCTCAAPAPDPRWEALKKISPAS